jgi:Sel1 repeat
LIYSKGKDVAQDFREAAKWWRLAAAQGDAEAQKNLGAMYAQGQGLTQDFVLAYMWLNLSAAQGNAEAAKFLDDFAKSMSAQQIAEAETIARNCKVSNYSRCDVLDGTPRDSPSDFKGPVPDGTPSRSGTSTQRKIIGGDVGATVADLTSVSSRTTAMRYVEAHDQIKDRYRSDVVLM